MILIEDARNIPDVLWTGLSDFERLAVPEEYQTLLLRKSDPAKIFIEDTRTLLVAGVYQESMLGARHFWALISPELSRARISSLRALREYGDEVLPGSETLIKANEETAIRLAKFFGFESTGRKSGNDYEVYRRPA